LAEHQLAIQKNLPHGHVRTRNALQHRCHRNLADLTAWLADRCKWDRQQACVFDVIDSTDSDIFRYAMAQSDQRMHEVSCGSMVGANERLGMQSLHHTLNFVRIRWVQPGGSPGVRIFWLTANPDRAAAVTALALYTVFAAVAYCLEKKRAPRKTLQKDLSWKLT
jgi:hypothetical protein